LIESDLRRPESVTKLLRMASNRIGEIARLRAALEVFADESNWSEDSAYHSWHWYGWTNGQNANPIEIARKSLEGP
jgi:hypothetical protein